MPVSRTCEVMGGRDMAAAGVLGRICAASLSTRCMQECGKRDSEDLRRTFTQRHMFRDSETCSGSMVQFARYNSLVCIGHGDVTSPKIGPGRGGKWPSLQAGELGS